LLDYCSFSKITGALYGKDHYRAHLWNIHPF
jgi:hypothetical protein